MDHFIAKDILIKQVALNKWSLLLMIQKVNTPKLQPNKIENHIKSN